MSTGVEKSVFYFEKKGPHNTDKTLEIALTCCKALSINKIVVASSRGNTALKLKETADASLEIIAVTYSAGSRYVEDVEAFNQNADKLVESGIRIVRGIHALSGTERAFETKYKSQFLPLNIVADTLRMFCHGVKVCVEIAAILIFILLPVLAFGGTMTETRNLALAADGIDTLVVKCGAGSLKLSGVSNGSKIRISAQIEVENFSETDFKEFIKTSIQLSLNKQANRATLQSDMTPLANPDQDARINLKIEIPETMNVDIIDGSGSIGVDSLNANLRIDDDTGSIKLKNISGEVRIGDSSGSIAIEEITGNIFITDGSGSIAIESVRGDLNVKDGSGKITIVDIDGNVTVSDGSGSIEIQDVKKNVLIIIREEGSGVVEVEGTKGKVTIRP